MLPNDNVVESQLTFVAMDLHFLAPPALQFYPQSPQPHRLIFEACLLLLSLQTEIEIVVFVRQRRKQKLQRLLRADAVVMEDLLPPYCLAEVRLPPCCSPA